MKDNTEYYRDLVLAAQMLQTYCTGRKCVECIFCKEFCVLENAPCFYDLPEVKSNDV